MSLTLWDDTLAELARPASQPARLRLRHEDGTVQPVALAAWHGPPDVADRILLDRLLVQPGPVLDVGCGPGRLAAAARSAGLPSLGIDLAPSAVRLARAKGALAAVACVFGELPHPGPWRHILLIDGNIGIGGRPESLLRRCVELLADDGVVHVEVGAPGSGNRSLRVRLERNLVDSGNWFPWAEVSTDGLPALAAEAGLLVLQTWSHAGRWFGELGRKAT